MALIENIKLTIKFINEVLHILIPVLCGIALLIALAQFTRNKIQKEGAGKGIYLGVLAFLEIAFLALVIYFLPIWLAGLFGISRTDLIRWGILYLLVPVWYRYTRKHSGTRGAVSVFFILTIFFAGWLYDQWIGIFFISIPTTWICYHAIRKLAQAVYPASNPEDKREVGLKTQAFLVYLLGVQYPVWVARSKAARDFDKRIDGDTARDIGKPGVVWTHSHQVVGSSLGIEFNKADGPGIIFTEQYESPVALVDLRTQLRVIIVNTVTKDGMEIPVIVFTAFAIDKSSWPHEDWTRAFFSKIKYLIGRDYEVDHTVGSHPYSSGRVRSAISTSGINNPSQNNEKKSEFYWDEWVIRQVEHAVRQVVSARGLDELWRPQKDGLGISALDEMANELKNLLSPQLAEAGVQIFTARIVNYKLEEKSEGETKEHHIAQQNIKTWSSYWERRVTEAQADVEFIYREEIEKAHAYSKSVLLSAIADSIIKARAIRKDLPRHVIAQYFVHALEEYIKKLPELDLTDSKQRIERIKDLMTYASSEESE